MAPITRILGVKYKEGISDEEKRTVTNLVLDLYKEIQNTITNSVEQLPKGWSFSVDSASGVLKIASGGRNIHPGGMSKGLDAVFVSVFTVCHYTCDA